MGKKIITSAERLRNDQTEFIEGKRARTADQLARSQEKRDRERRKAKAIQAEIDAMKPKSLEVMLFGRNIRDKIRGAKCGYDMGGGGH